MNTPQNSERPFASYFRIEFVVLAIAAVVLLLLAGQLVRQQQRADHTSLQQVGSALARMAGELIDGRAPARQVSARMQTLLALQTGISADYLAIVSPQGELLQQAGDVPREWRQHSAAFGAGQWFGERAIHHGGIQYTEFFAPVIENGKLTAFALAGYRSPDSTQAWFTPVGLGLLVVAGLFMAWRLRHGNDTQPQPVQDSAASDIDSGNRKHTPEVRQADNHPKADNTTRGNDSAVVSSKLLERQKDKLSAIIESMPCAVMVLDNNGAVSYANSKLYDLFRLQQGTILGSRTEQWCTNDEVRQVLSSAQILQDKKCHNRRFDVSVEGAPVSVEICPLSGDDGSVMVMLSDNDPVRTEQAAVSDFIAHVAHQIKTPLNTLYMYSELLQSNGFGTPEKTARAAGVIYQEARRMARLIDNLLNINMFDSGSVQIERKKVEVQQCIDEVIDNIGLASGMQRNRIIVDAPPDIPALMLDRSLLVLALGSLLENAIQYSDEDTPIKVSVSQREYDVRIEIADSGVGIGEQDQKHIFDMFYRSENEQVRRVKGNGLGLPLARRIIEGHGGSLYCNSEPGKGSTFTVVLSKSVNQLEGVA